MDWVRIVVPPRKSIPKFRPTSSQSAGRTRAESSRPRWCDHPWRRSTRLHVTASAGDQGDELASLQADDAAVAALTEVKGIGRWSAQMHLIFHLGRLDVLPVDDLGLQNAAARAYGAGAHGPQGQLTSRSRIHFHRVMRDTPSEAAVASRCPPFRSRAARSAAALSTRSATRAPGSTM